MFSRPVRTEYGTLGKKVYNTRVYDEFTGRLTRQTTDRDLAPQRIDDTTYSYDDAGNVTNITTASGQDAGKAVDTQCFANDPLGRLTEAWTAKTDCSAQPSATTVGGPDAYWQTFTYDAVGNRVKQVDHGTGALAGSDATTTYTHNDPKTGLPHAVQSATVTGGPHNGQKSTFGYDKAGNTTKRAIGTREQSMTWDAEGHLATLTEDGRTTGYQYDADGDRLITKDADGTQTLTLPGDNELKVKANGTKEGVRYYTHEGETVAVRTSSGFSFLIPDQQGTAMAAIAMTTLAVTRRKQLPFGGIRSQQAESLPGTRGFVGGTNDPTGLVHLGAREYDPALGRFLSVDPVIDLDDPAQMNAYSYAHNNPVTKSDPSGLRPDGPAAWSLVQRRAMGSRPRHDGQLDQEERQVGLEADTEEGHGFTQEVRRLPRQPHHLQGLQLQLLQGEGRRTVEAGPSTSQGAGHRPGQGGRSRTPQEGRHLRQYYGRRQQGVEQHGWQSRIRNHRWCERCRPIH